MSYYTKLEIEPFGHEPLSIAHLQPRMVTRLDEDRISRDVWRDLDAAFATGRARLEVHGAYVASLVELIHDMSPATEFGARGVGEELRDMWIKEFRAGRKVFEVGDFYSDESIARTLSSPRRSTWARRLRSLSPLHRSSAQEGA